MKRARVNNVNQWSGWWYYSCKASKLTFYNIHRNQRLGL